MVAAFVSNGALDAQLVYDTCQEMYFQYAKIQPYLAGFREKMHLPEFLITRWDCFPLNIPAFAGRTLIDFTTRCSFVAAALYRKASASGWCLRPNLRLRSGQNSLRMFPVMSTPSCMPSFEIPSRAVRLSA